VSVSLDRVSLPMEEPKPRPPGRPKKDAPKRSIQRVFRMAYAGTVTLRDENGEALHTIRYGCMPHADEKALVTSMASDVLALRRKDPSLAVRALADGSPENWTLLGDALDEKSFGDVHWLIDFWHVLEKLAAAAKVVHGEQESSGVVRRWKFRLLNSNSAAAEILEELTASGKEHVRTGDDQPVHHAMTYLENNAARMKYATARYLGLPIGSGAVEATCKSLVGVRMKRPGPPLEACNWRARDSAPCPFPQRPLGPGHGPHAAIRTRLREAGLKLRIGATPGSGLLQATARLHRTPNFGRLRSSTLQVTAALTRFVHES
jgi:hypothetical protein